MQHPFTCIGSGSAGCGKCVFTFKLIRHAEQVIKPPPERIIYCYGEYQKVFDNYWNVEFHDGLPDHNDFDDKSRTLLVLDDLMTSTDDRVVEFFTKISHHRNLFVVYLTQNIFYKNKQSRTLSLNSHYLVLLKNARDASKVANLARQMYLGKSAFMVESFKNATSAPYGHILIEETTENLGLGQDFSQEMTYSCTSEWHGPNHRTMRSWQLFISRWTFDANNSLS